MQQGWIKISRNISEHWIFQDAEYFKWWFDLLLMAAWKERRVFNDGHIYTLQRGQMIASVSYLSQRWHRGKDKVLRFLNTLQKDGMIERFVKDRSTSILTICNYEKYQVVEDTLADNLNEGLNDGVTGGYADGKQPSPDTLADTIPDTLNRGVVHQKPAILADTLKGWLKGCKSESCDKGTGVTPDTLADTIPDTLPDTLPDTNRRNKRNKENIYRESSSFHSEDSSSTSPSGELDPASSKGQKVDIKKFFEFFNSEMKKGNCLIPQVVKITERRKSNIEARCREFGKRSLFEMVVKSAASDFLNGRNDRGWVANFDWLIRPNNFPKVLEGNYDNKNNNISSNDRSNKTIEDKRGRFETSATSNEDFEGTF